MKNSITMKKLLLLLMLVPVFAMGQITYVGTVTSESDQIVKFSVTNPNYVASLITKVDTLDGGTDATIELVVADDFTNASRPVAIADSLFVRLDASMIATYSAVGVYGFEHEPVPYDWIGFRLTKGSVTKWSIRYELKLYERK